MNKKEYSESPIPNQTSVDFYDKDNNQTRKIDCLA